MARLKSSVCSTTGTRISSYPYASITARALRSTCCHRPISAARTSFMPVTGGIWRLIFFFWLSGARERAAAIHDEARAFSIDGAGWNLASLAVDFDGHTGGVAEHDAQRAAAAHGLNAAGARDVVEQFLVARIVD